MPITLAPPPSILVPDTHFSDVPLQYTEITKMAYRSVGYDVPLSFFRGKQLNINSCGAGMQSSAALLMSCENALTWTKHPKIPIYDVAFFCDLGFEPPYVYDQMAFLADACKKAGIPFYILYTHLYEDYLERFGHQFVKSIPFWTLSPEGKKGKWQRMCTIVYKIEKMQQFVKYEMMGYKWRGHIKAEHIGMHNMHLGFSIEELSRCSKSKHRLFKNTFPLVDMGVDRAHNYAYILDEWGLATKGSACAFCPFHQNYFFQYIKRNYPETYNAVVEFDDMLGERVGLTDMNDQVFISKARKRVKDLTCEECQDAQTFLYQGKEVWNGF